MKAKSAQAHPRRALITSMSLAQQFYQAIGDIFATRVIASDGTKFLETQQARYRAFVPFKVEKRYLDLYQGQQVYWRVYPQFKEQATSDGFVLSEPNIQVFERSFKQEQAKESDTGTQIQSSATEPPLGVSELLAASEAKIQTLQVTTADSEPESPEKPDPQAQPSTPKSKPKLKKLGKFNVEIRWNYLVQ